MTTSRSSRPSQLLTLSLAFLLTGLLACSKGSEGEETQNPANPDTATESAGTAPAGGSGGDSPVSVPGQAAPANAKPADTGKMPAVVARINGVTVTKDELLKEAEQMRARFAQMSGGQQVPPMSDEFYDKVLEGIVARTLLLQEAEKQGVTVSDEEVKGQIAALRGRFPDQAAFEKALSEQGMTEAGLMKDLRREAVVQKYVETRIFNQVQVSDQQARAFYDQNKDKMQQPERAHLRHILVKVDAGAAEADKQKARAKADDLLARIKKGEDFAKLASENSDDPGSKSQGGDLSWVTRGQTVPPFEKAAFALTRPNELSPVTESQFGYHIIQLVERQAPTAVPFEQAKDRINQMLKQQEAGKALQARVDQLKSQGKVETFI